MKNRSEELVYENQSVMYDYSSLFTHLAEIFKDDLIGEAEQLVGGVFPLKLKLSFSPEWKPTSFDLKQLPWLSTVFVSLYEFSQSQDGNYIDNIQLSLNFSKEIELNLKVLTSSKNYEQAVVLSERILATTCKQMKAEVVTYRNSGNRWMKITGQFDNKKVYLGKNDDKKKSKTEALRRDYA